MVVVVAVVVVFAVVEGVVVVLVVVLVVVEWDVGGSLDVVDDVPDVVSGSDVVVAPENHIFKEKLVLCDKSRCLIRKIFSLLNSPAHLLSLGSTSQCPWLSQTTVSI